MDYCIRQARLEDAGTVAKIWVEGQRAMPVYIEERDYTDLFAAKISHQTDTFPVWVAESAEGSILGWQALSPSISHPYLQQFFAESSTYIDPFTRTSGLGRKLLAHALEHARNSTLRYITAYIKTSNAAALRIADLFGFQRIGVLPHPGNDEKVPHLMFLTYAVPQAAASSTKLLRDLMRTPLVGIETAEFARPDALSAMKL
jgi:L-amino acid N-acyltransferase YncA